MRICLLLSEASRRVTEDRADAGSLARRYERERRARLAAEAIAEDVTAKFYATVLELDKVNAQLTEANEVLDGANQAIREFVSIASHDLRGPLSSILGFAALLADRWKDITDQDRTKYIEIILRQGGLLARLVEDLLTVSRIEAGEVETHIEDIYIRTAIEQVVSSFQEHPEIKVSSPRELRVKADPDHLERILNNYIGNAFKYGRAPVEASASAKNGWVEVHIRDQGDGVPEEFLPRLFEKFARAEGTSRQQKGTGLGLSIVKGLARINGGDAWYEPNKPSGACFAVRLPRCDATTGHAR